MAPPNHYPFQPEPRQQMRDTIESISQTVYASRQTIGEALEAIARAEEVLARRISERNKDFPGSRS